MRHNRTLRRAKQTDRINLIEAEKRLSLARRDRSERERIEKLWEQSINFFADSGDIGIDTKESK